MSLHLPNVVNTPPGGWRFLVPETNWKSGSYSNWPQLRDNLRAHYESAGYSMPSDIFDKVEAQICEENKEYCNGNPSLFERLVNSAKNLRHTFNAAYTCLVTLVSNRAGSGERPTQALADSRAGVCAVCPENDAIEPCSHCNMGTINRLVEKLVGAHKTTSDDKLKFCKVCHCNLRAKVWTKHEAMWNHMSDAKKAQLPKSCWLVTEASPDERFLAQ